MNNIEFRVIAKKSKAPVFIYVTAYGMPNTGSDILEELKKDNIEITLVEILIKDWNKQLSPWEAEGIRPEGDMFLGEGKSTLNYILNTVLPIIKNEIIDMKSRTSETNKEIPSMGSRTSETNKEIPDMESGILENDEIYLVGYSLAGLFTLWSLFESDKFAGGVCCSSSLWYPGWKEYVSTRQLSRSEKIYISLEKKESKTSNILMAGVEDITNFTYKKLLADRNCQNAILVMNPGGHFMNPTKRLADGIRWIVNELV